ncbi:PREDICTED: alpha-N-acetylgalactosaminidase-like [Amphimedon queenslandica]|uniref:Alpha-galactosidase n=1 Tax=Amphimedon queenslandica TaxID=400682 RepID=A0A1X7U630_AMPQE|nr:PREDICTED: alpha-N-acetylgalactosaminidase-like [Amphimedon queenslandica]|eukprot:XP_019855912.1 PREDICTED: alpha-N-acetylgalactosaminidase-like [Amphimedon queenslandica]
MSVFKFALAVLLVSSLWHSSLSLDNGVALTPPMGWLAWERYACNTNCKDDPDNCIGEKLFMRMADHIASDGFKDAGYQYINIDDCWASKERDSQGRLQADPDRFPSGIAALANYVHSKGLKLGIYADYGTHTCGGYPGSGPSMKLDIDTFASWGIDMLKMDGCNANIDGMPQGYKQVSDYLNATGRHIVFSCSWPAYWVGSGKTVNYTYAGETCNLWRNYHDISDSWDSVTSIIDYYAKEEDDLIPAAGPGHWNDPDMLIVGDFGLSVDEQQAQMAIWSILSAPLLMSNDLSTISDESKAILQNSDVISVSQDKLGHQGKVVATVGKVRVFSKLLSDNSMAVVFFNSGSFAGPQNVTVTFQTVGLSSSKATVKDLFQQKDLGTFQGSFTTPVDPSSVVMVKMTPA